MVGFFFLLKINVQDVHLNIVLHEGVQRLPSKTLCQLLRTHRSVAELQLVEDSLQGQGHAALGVVTFCRHFIYSFTQL